MKKQLLARAALLIAIIVALPRLACAQAVETTLASFDGTNGYYPTQGLLLASDGNFYGTTPFYGTAGTVFRITPTGTLTTIYRFSGSPPDEGNPLAALIQGSDGNLYGTTAGGGGLAFQYGTVFKLTLDGTLTTLFVFTYDSTTDTFPNGNAPEAALVQGTDGNFYGTTAGGGRQNGGSSAQGTIFKMSPAGDLLGSFPVYGGLGIGFPNAPLVLGTDGAFYSTSYTNGGGLASGGVYQFSAAGVVTVLHGFNDTPDGNAPNGGLVLGSDGNFYGTTEYGGTSHLGTVYRISPEGTYEELISFNNSNGQQPFGQMIQATDGNFYGTTFGGGSLSNGTVFQLTPAGVLTTVYNFTYSGSDGAQPKGTLVQGADRRLYGTTQAGGLYGLGTVFALDLHLSTLQLTAAVSRKTHGASGDFDLPLVLSPAGSGTVEPRANGPTTVVFDFSENIVAADGTIDSNEFTITNATFSSASISGNELTLNLTGVIDQSVVSVTLNGIDDTNGNALAGDNDVEIRALVGDANQDQVVNKVDFQAVRAHVDQVLDQMSGNYLFDLNLSGSIGKRDSRVARVNVGHTVP